MEKEYILNFATKDLENLKAIQKGEKWVETRAGSPRYQNIEKGDILVLWCGELKIKKRVKRVKHFKTIGAMLKIYKVSDIMPHVKNEKEMRIAYSRYSGYTEKLRTFGILTFEI